MRVVVPYVDLRPEVRVAIEADGREAEYVYVGGRPEAYHELLLRLWGEGRGWVNVEHDVVVRPGAIAELEACPEPWCGFAYSLGGYYGGTLGCTRFSDELVAGRPGVMPALDGLPFDGTPRRYWGRLDTRLQVVLEQHEGLRMHLHWPALDHLNPDKPPPIYNCPRCGAAIPDDVARSGPPPLRCPACG